jgi:probable F420-dependent oxidoreductase
VRIGVTVPNVHETLAEPATIEAAGRLAEELGFESIWVNDHVVIPRAPDGSENEPGYAAAYGQQRGQNVYDPLITLAYLAGATERIRLGTSVFLLPLRNPLVAAKQVMSLDRLSAGRLIFGVGVGWLEGEYAALGVPFKQRGARMNEAIEIFKLACGQERASFHGRHYEFGELELLPEPAQRPHPPLWIGGRSEAAMRRAARFGDAWHPSHLTCDEFRRQLPAFEEECERAGRSRGDVMLATRRKLVRAEPAGEPEAARVLHGDAASIAAAVSELEEVGVAHLIVELPGSSDGELLENLDWFGREVLPAVAHARA